MQTETAAQSKASRLSFFSVLTKLDLAGVCLCAPSGSLFQISEFLCVKLPSLIQSFVHSGGVPAM